MPITSQLGLALAGFGAYLIAVTLSRWGWWPMLAIAISLYVIGYTNARLSSDTLILAILSSNFVALAIPIGRRNKVSRILAWLLAVWAVFGVAMLGAYLAIPVALGALANSWRRDRQQRESIAHVAWAHELVSRYGAALGSIDQDTHPLLRPQSQLPASKGQLEAAIKTLVLVADESKVNTLTYAFTDLGSFIPDVDAAFAAKAQRSRDPAELHRLGELLAQAQAECESRYEDIARLAATVRQKVPSIGSPSDRPS